MSVITIRSIFCDNGCGNWRFQRPDPASTLRLLASREGWTRRGSKDICPKCAAPAADATPAQVQP